MLKAVSKYLYREKFALIVTCCYWHVCRVVERRTEVVVVCIIHRCFFYQRKTEMIAMDSEHLQHNPLVIDRLLHLQKRTLIYCRQYGLHIYYIAIMLLPHADYRFLVVLMPSTQKSEHSLDHSTRDFTPFHAEADIESLQ